MPLHQWNHSESLIKQIEYRIHGKDAEAFIASPDNAPPESMANIPSRLQEEGFTVSPQQLDGKQVLRVTGFRYPSELNSKLEAAGVISGEHTQTETAWEKSQPKKSFVEKVKDNSLQLSGIAYTIGNLAVTGSGIIRKDYAEVGTGTVWLAADALLAACGKDDKDDQANKLFGKLREYLHKEGVEIPRGTALTPDELAKPGGVIEKTGEFLKEHRVDIKNAAEILGGALYFKAGLNQKNPFKTAAGACIVTGFLTGLLVAEKDPGEQDRVANGDALAEKLAGKKEGLLHKAKEWVQEKPLRLTGTLALTHNALTMTGAIREQRKNNNPETLDKLKSARNEIKNSLNFERNQQVSLAAQGVAKSDVTTKLLEKELVEREKALAGFEKAKNGFRFNMAQSAVMVVANALYGMSSKNTADKSQEAELTHDICATAASIVASQPVELREHLTQRVAAFFASQPQVHASAEDICKEIHQKVDELATSPWLARAKSSKLSSQEHSLPA